MLIRIAIVTILAAMWTGAASHAQDHWFVYNDADRIRSCPNCNHNLPHKDIYGWKGNPWRDRELGGCRCGKHSGKTHYNFSSHWPSPFSVLIDHGPRGKRWGPATDTTKPRLRDHLDVFAHIRLLPNPRCDNGYTGPDCDPWGLVGATRRGVVVESTGETRPFNETAPADPPERLPSGLQPPQPLTDQRFMSPAPRTARSPAEMLWESHPIR